MDIARVVKCTSCHPPSRFDLISYFLSVILSLQQPSGVFAGDSFGEIDTRFSYCALNALSLLGRLDDLGDTGKQKAVEYIVKCRNYDGGFGNVAGAESHAGQGPSEFRNYCAFVNHFELYSVRLRCSTGYS